MNIYTVRDNLKNTIAGKERALPVYEHLAQKTGAGAMAAHASAEFLKINIAELKRILQDVEACCEKASYDSWKTNPDRSGGAFTQDEIDNANAWR